jgi:hypothetical protein
MCTQINKMCTHLAKDETPPPFACEEQWCRNPFLKSAPKKTIIGSSSLLLSRFTSSILSFHLQVLLVRRGLLRAELQLALQVEHAARPNTQENEENQRKDQALGDRAREEPVRA